MNNYSSGKISSYANYIATDYVKKLSQYAPEARDFIEGLKDLALSGKIEDSRLYKIAESYATLVEKSHKQSDSEKREYYMRPFVYGNGLIRYIDMNGNGELQMYPTSNGLYAIKGSKELIELVGGRGLLSTFIQNLDDGDFFHTSKMGEKK